MKKEDNDWIIGLALLPGLLAVIGLVLTALVAPPRAGSLRTLAAETVSNSAETEGYLEGLAKAHSVELRSKAITAVVPLK